MLERPRPKLKSQGGQQHTVLQNLMSRHHLEMFHPAHRMLTGLADW
jgi:hypothetical protein